MGKSSGKAPPPPDPKQTAAAQTGTNIGTAIAQQALNSTNQVTPYGSLTYQVTGSTTYKDPYTGKTYEIPKYTATTALSPEQQALYDQQVGLRGDLNTSAQGILDSGRFNSPVDLSRAALDPYIQDNYLDDFNKQWDTNRSSLETQLANKGLKLGSAAYDKAIQDFQTSRGNAYDNFLGAMYSNAQNALLGERGQALNELSTFLTGGQQANPSFQNTPQSGINSTDVAGLINQQYQAQLNQYNQEQANKNSLLGGLFDLGGSLLTGGWMLSDRRAKEDIQKVGEIEFGSEDANGVERETELPFYSFKYKPKTGLGGGLMQLGVMAQDVEKVMPEAVGKTKGGMKAVNYAKIAEAMNNG